VLRWGGGVHPRYRKRAQAAGCTLVPAALLRWFSCGCRADACCHAAITNNNDNNPTPSDTLPTAFSKEVCDRMVFSITDLDGDGQLCFDEFVLAATLLGTFSQVRWQFIGYTRKVSIYNCDGPGIAHCSLFRTSRPRTNFLDRSPQNC